MIRYLRSIFDYTDFFLYLIDFLKIILFSDQ